MEDMAEYRQESLLDLLAYGDETEGMGGQDNQSIDDIPFVAIGNNELGEKVGKTVLCKNCGKQHKVRYGKKVLPDGTQIPSTELGFITCLENGSDYLVAVKCRRVFP